MRYTSTDRELSTTGFALTACQRADPVHYQNGTVVQSASRRWTGLTATLAEIRANGHTQSMQVELGGEQACLSAVLEETGGRLAIETEGRALPAVPASRAPLSLIPAGQTAQLRTTGVRHLTHLVLRFDPATLAGLIDDPIDIASTFRARLAISDGPLQALCRLFSSECAVAEQSGQRYGESLSVALLLRLTQLGRADEQARVGGLTPWRFQRVLEHIEANFGEEVRLDKLAELARLSTSHFSKAFKQSVGVSPHQWLIDLRCTKAKQMMLDSHLPLAEIALATGFSDQSHFTRAFGQTNGVPPAMWRRAQAPGMRLE